MEFRMTIDTARRKWLGTFAAAGAISLLPRLAQGAEGRQVRIGYQKSSTLITILKGGGVLEKQLEALGAKISWHEFTSGLPLLEALNTGNIDFSADVADTVPVFALAAGARLAYVAQEAPSPSAQGLVVRADSPIRSIADLKGKRVAVAKAAGSHYLLIALLEKSGLKFKDIEPAYLSPADGRAAFERGAVDAWVVWDPFLAAVQRQSQVRLLADGRGVADYQRYYLTSLDFLSAAPDILTIFFNELKKTGRWVKQNSTQAAALLAPIWGLDAATAEAANARRSYEVRGVVPEALTEQQRIADTFFAEGLLPRKVSVSSVVLWKPPA
jgi:sulfonate transport system substrate-binding protein